MPVCKNNSGLRMSHNDFQDFFSKSKFRFLWVSVVPPSTHTSQGLSHKGRYPLLSGLGGKFIFLRQVKYITYNLSSIISLILKI